MTDWTMCRWHGAPGTLEAALRDLGWAGPGEAPQAPTDKRVGGFLPPAGEPTRRIDGLAYALVVAREPLPLPPGLSETGPDLSTLLLGSFCLLLGSF